MSNKQKKNQNYQMPKGFVSGTKRTRGNPILHEDVKKKINLTLTPIAIELITNAAQSQGISRSELIEQWARTSLATTSSEAT